MNFIDVNVFHKRGGKKRRRLRACINEHKAAISSITRITMCMYKLI